MYRRFVSQTIAAPQTAPIAPNQLRSYFSGKPEESDKSREVVVADVGDDAKIVKQERESDAREASVDVAGARLPTDTEILCARAAASIAMVGGGRFFFERVLKCCVCVDVLSLT